MNRLQAAALVALTVPIVGTACWLDVPNLESTEGGYLPRQASPAGEAAADLVVAAGAEVELPHDEGCPAVGEDLRSVGDRAVLTVRAHGTSLAPPPPAGKSISWTSRPARGLVRSRPWPAPEQRRPGSRELSKGV